MASIMRKMNIISRCEGIYRTNELEEELAPIYHTYIISICMHPGKSQEWLARHICINKSSVARHIAFLEKNGYIARKPSEEDKRELHVYPTDKMLGIYPRVLEITKRWNSIMAEDISEEELSFFLEILDKMAQKSTEIIYSGGKVQ